MSERTSPDSAMAQRLKTLRMALGYESQPAFAAFLGIEFKRYSNLERGHPISSQVAILLCQKVSGLSTDWIYFGREDALSVSLAARLREAGTRAKTSA